MCWLSQEHCSQIIKKVMIFSHLMCENDDEAVHTDTVTHNGRELVSNCRQLFLVTVANYHITLTLNQTVRLPQTQPTNQTEPSVIQVTITDRQLSKSPAKGWAH